MAKNDKELRGLKKDSATVARIVRDRPKKPSAPAARAYARDSKNVDKVYEKSAEELSTVGFGAKTRNSAKFKAISSGTKQQVRKDIKTGKVGKPVFGGEGPRKGVVPGGITKKPKGR